MHYVKVIFEISAALPSALPRDYGSRRAPSPRPISVSRALWSCAHTFEKARCLGRLHIRPTIVKQGHRSAFWDGFELEGKGSCCLSMGGGGGDDKRANLRFCPPHLLKLIPLLAQLKEAKSFKKRLTFASEFLFDFILTLLLLLRIFFCRRQRSPSPL